MNVKTPGAGRRTGAFGKGVVFAADPSEIAQHAAEIQTERLLRRFKFGREFAAEVAALAHPQIDSWRGAR